MLVRVKHTGGHAHICLQTHRTSLEGLTAAPREGAGGLGNRSRRESSQLHKNFCAFGTLKPVKHVTYSQSATIERKDKDRSELNCGPGLSPPLAPTCGLALCLWHRAEGCCSGVGRGHSGAQASCSFLGKDKGGVGSTALSLMVSDTRPWISTPSSPSPAPTPPPSGRAPSSACVPREAAGKRPWPGVSSALCCPSLPTMVTSAGKREAFQNTP